MKRFGEKLRILRTQRGISLRELAEILEVDHSHLGKIEAGTRGPSVELTLKIARLFDVTPNHLMLDDLKLD